jgi:hypothetical protein
MFGTALYQTTAAPITAATMINTRIRTGMRQQQLPATSFVLNLRIVLFRRGYAPQDNDVPIRRTMSIPNHATRQLGARAIR